MSEMKREHAGNRRSSHGVRDEFRAAAERAIRERAIENVAPR